MEIEESIKKAGGPSKYFAERLDCIATWCVVDVRYDGLTDFVRHLQGELPLTNAPVGSYVVRELLKLMSERDEQLLWQYVFGQIGSSDHLEIARCAELLASLPNAPKSLVKLVESAQEHSYSANVCNASAYKESPLLIAIITVVQRINSVMQVEKWKRGIKQRQTKIDEFASEKKTPVASEESIEAPPPSPEMTDCAHRKRGRKPAASIVVPAKVEDVERPKDEPAKPSAMQIEMGMKPAEEKRQRGRPRKNKIDAPTK